METMSNDEQGVGDKQDQPVECMDAKPDKHGQGITPQQAGTFSAVKITLFQKV